MGTEEMPKPTAAFVLCLIGGIISLIVGFLLSLEALVYLALIPRYFGYHFAELLALVGPWILVAAIVVLVGSYMIYTNPEKVRTWSIIILVFSLLGGGGILGIIGGALAISWKPTPPPTPISAITRICPKCGHVLKEEKIKFCPYCGNELA